MNLYIPLGSSPDIRRRRPYKHGRFRRCGNGPEHVSFHYPYFRRKPRGESMSLAARLGPVWPLSLTLESLQAPCVRG
jgi:hypothetical protein